MKKWTLFLSLYFCVCLLAGCTTAAGTDAPAPGGAPSSEEQTDGGTAQPAAAAVLCRVVSEEIGSVLLADTESSVVYYLPLEGLTVTLDGQPFDLTAPGAYQNLPAGSLAGALAEITYDDDGTVLETWPAQFANVTAINLRTEGFDDRCALYLRVLEDLWAVDPGLNSGDLTYIGVDLTKTSLSESERAAVAWAFAGKHGAEPVEGTYDELVEQGYITGEPLGDGAPEGAKFWQWTDGCLFSITESDEPVVFSLPNIAPGEKPPAYDAVRFDAEKWRSGLGAYYFTDCTAVRNADGHWGDYTVGGEAIS